MGSVLLVGATDGGARGFTAISPYFVNP